MYGRDVVQTAMEQLVHPSTRQEARVLEDD